MQWIAYRAWSARGAPETADTPRLDAVAPSYIQWAFRADDSAFLAALARITPPDAFPPRLTPFLAAVVKRTEEAAAAGICPPGHLVALQRLAAEVSRFLRERSLPRLCGPNREMFQGAASDLRRDGY